MQLYLRKDISGILVPVDTFTEENLEKIPVNSVRMYEKHGAIQDPLLFRKFHKMISVAFDNLPEGEKIPNKEILRKKLLCLAGHCDYVRTAKDEYLIPKSMAFGAIDNDELRELFRNVYSAIIEEYGDIVTDFTKTFY